jgi:hypothetical protein
MILGVVFGLLLLLEFYLFALVFSGVDESKWRKFILLGPFALLVPGVLSARGWKALAGVLVVTAAIVILGFNLFGLQDLP